MQLHVEVEVGQIVQEGLLVVIDVEIRIGLRQTPQLVGSEAPTVGDVDLQVREAIQHATIDQVPEALGFVVVHSDDGSGFETVGVGLLAPGHGLVVAMHEYR
ncbi:hypothetical protein D3C76_1456250 [compost metagenome]